METSEYLNRLLLRYSGTFDIYQPYRIGDKEYAAYGYFSQRTEKYVLVREANMWTSECFEHILFLEREQCDEGMLLEVQNLLENYMEPQLVRKGERYPAPNHMYSYLTIAVICRQEPDPTVSRRIRRFRFEKGYRFNFLGYSQAHFLCASMDNRKVISNYAARKTKALYREIYREVEE